MIHRIPRLGVVLATLFVLALCLPASAQQPYIILDGQPQAEIVIVQEPPRSVQLAAWELQLHLRKISGATLPIVHEPSESVVSIYIGASAHTERLGITNEGLEAGAYRIVSGDNWLVLIGTDTDFQPTEPYTTHRRQRNTPEMLEPWDAVTPETWNGVELSPWGHPEANAFKNLFQRIDRMYLGKDSEEALDLWAYDERGSFNAVCAYLRKLGVRWYMPGELGAEIPQRESILLPEIDETVIPAFAVRDCNIRIGIHDDRLALWGMRLGMRQPYGFGWAHGLNQVTSREEMQREHPEYYLLTGQGRYVDYRGAGKQCLSSPGLFANTVAFAQTVHDYYGQPVISIQPSDGYTSFCQCELCEGKYDTERHVRGSMSDYVWGFTARVANEVAKTHPDLIIQNMAYNNAMLPPTFTDKLPDNVLVCLIGARRPTEIDPEERQRVREWRQEWATFTDRQMVNFENYPHTARGQWLPSFTAHTNAASINAIKGKFLGEQINPDSHVFMGAPVFNSYQFYFTFRMYWGDENQDIRPILEEYYSLFYGPAREPMKAFFEYCEANYPRMRHEKPVIDHALGLFAEARDRVDPESVYGQRLGLLAQYLAGLENRSRQVVKEQERQHSPTQRMGRGAYRVVIDGDPDEPFWHEVHGFANGSMRENQTGRPAAFLTTFQIAWGADDVKLVFRCREPFPETLQLLTDQHDDPVILEGDHLMLLIETEQKSFYQIAVAPNGAVYDLYREGGEHVVQWDSQAEVATTIGEDGWTVELRLPVIEDPNDPFHQIVGRKPISSLPWYFNLGRVRPRASGTERYAFSPTSTDSLVVPERFAKLYQ